MTPRRWHPTDTPAANPHDDRALRATGGSVNRQSPVVEITVYGSAQPAGSKRAFVVNGRAHVTDDAKGSRPWKQRVAQAAGESYGGELLSGPLSVEMTFYQPRPKGHYGTGRNAEMVKASAPARPTTRPDVLKLARAVEDALSGVVYRDDSQIVDEHLHKRYGEPARCAIRVEAARA